MQRLTIDDLYKAQGTMRWTRNEANFGAEKLTITQLLKKPSEYNDRNTDNRPTSGSDSETYQFRIIPVYFKIYLNIILPSRLELSKLSILFTIYCQSACPFLFILHLLNIILIPTGQNLSRNFSPSSSYPVTRISQYAYQHSIF